MRRLTFGTLVIGLAAPLLLFAAAGHAPAGAVLIDFEQYADGRNLHGVNLGGVTLTNPSGKVEIYDDRFGVGYHSGTKSIASSSGLVSVNPLVGVFDDPVTSVSLWGGDEGWSPTEIDSWRLVAYDAKVGGNRVRRVNSGSWDGGPYRQLSISAPSILRFEAYWTGSQFGIGYDDLEFVTAPPPPEPAPGRRGTTTRPGSGAAIDYDDPNPVTEPPPPDPAPGGSGTTTQGGSGTIQTSSAVVLHNRGPVPSKLRSGSNTITLVDSRDNIGPSTAMVVNGPVGLDVPFAARSIGGGYDQWFAARGERSMSGDLTIELEDGFVPGPDHRFEIFKSYAPDGGSGSIGWYADWFSSVTLDPAWPDPQQWVWEFEYKDGGIGVGDQPEAGRPFFSASLRAVPEPSTLALLSMAALALTVGWWRRRKA